jgi:Transposase IS200 like
MKIRIVSRQAHERNSIDGRSHTKWECKYHVVFNPKRRRRTLFGQIRQHIGEVFHKLAAQKESRIEQGHLQARPCAHVDLDPAQKCRR